MSRHFRSIRLSRAPYEFSGDHLRDELARVDLLVRAQVVRWRLTIAEHKPENLWGMMHVSDGEIDQYMDSEVAPPDWIPEPALEPARGFWRAETDASQRIRHLVDRTPSEVDLRLERLCTAFELGEPERDVLLLCLLPELDVRYRRIYGYLQDDASRAHASAELLMQMLHPKAETLEAKRALFRRDGPLFRNRLLHDDREPEMAPAHLVRIDDRITSFLLGIDEPARAVERVVSMMRTDIEWAALTVDPALLESLKAFASFAPTHAGPVILYGPYGSGRGKAAGAIAHQAGMALLGFRTGEALRDAANWNIAVDLAYREAILDRAALFVHGAELLFQEDRPPQLWEYLAKRAETAPVLTFIAAEALIVRSRANPESRYLRFDFPPPHYPARQKIWLIYLPQDVPDRPALADELASAFQLTEGQVRESVAAAEAIARRRSPDAPRVNRDDLFTAARKQSGRRLTRFARRIEPSPSLTIDDVVLSEPNRVQLRELLDRVRLRAKMPTSMHMERGSARGNGLIALFAGPSGTGKTLSAELIASQQRADLYKVDASAVVSKWVGETEENLSRVFADAEGSDAILFFDECDSLFGQRGEINEARDRWANLQVNYLLQRIEDYSGVVILATNLRKNIDEAFLRRIQMIVEFPTPDPPLRFRIWKRAIPALASAVTDDELRLVAERFALTGGSIRNAIDDAAFRALAHNRDKIGLRDIADSVAREYQKLGKPITQGDFGEQFYAWAREDVLAPKGSARP